MGDNVLAALDGVDIHIKPHEFVSIIGPSGSGKSTLMNIIGCLDTADEGTYYLDGQEIGDTAVVVTEGVERAGFIDYLQKVYRNFMSISG